MEKYYVFYRWAYGSEIFREVFETQKEVEAFYKKAMASTSGSDRGESDYRDLIVVYGVICEFEPVKVVESWALKPLTPL